MQIFPPNFPLQVVKHHCHEHVFLIVIKQFDLWADISQIRTKSVSYVLYEMRVRTLLFASSASRAECEPEMAECRLY